MIRGVEFPNVSEALAEQQYADGLAAFRRGDNAACRRLSAAALATAAAAGSERGKALGHLGLSRADFRDGDYPGGSPTRSPPKTTPARAAPMISG